MFIFVKVHNFNAMKQTGNIHKMKSQIGEPIQYSMILGDSVFPVNEFLGKKITLTYENQINCINCGRKTPKSFGQGFCYPCFANSPENSDCIIRPELCRGHLGEGRDPKWELENHVQPHTVYLALSSDIKVGVTRNTQIPTRWIDQGASQAIILAQTSNRYEAGMIESILKQHISDKTNWQRMLKNQISDKSLLEFKGQMFNLLPNEWQKFVIPNSEIIELHYPVLQYPSKVISCSFDKTPIIDGVLSGIKGQYLIFDDNRVINIRNHSGYLISFEA